MQQHIAPQRTVRLGVTGGIGSGKSTLARMLAAQGALWLDADAISRRLTASGGEAISAVRETFSPQMIDASGALDRARMREWVFTQPQARWQLEAIIHPLVGRTMQTQAKQAAQQGIALVVFDLPLLVESGHWRGQLDVVTVVDCEESTQIERTMRRSALDRASVEKIMATQASRAQRRASADIVLYNNSDLLDMLQAQARAVLHGLRL